MGHGSTDSDGDRRSPGRWLRSCVASLSSSGGLVAEQGSANGSAKTLSGLSPGLSGLSPNCTASPPAQRFSCKSPGGTSAPNGAMVVKSAYVLSHHGSQRSTRSQDSSPANQRPPAIQTSRNSRHSRQGGWATGDTTPVSRQSKPRGSGAGSVRESGAANARLPGNKNSCFYVHMLKTNHYRAGGWRRDMMKSEMVRRCIYI